MFNIKDSLNEEIVVGFIVALLLLFFMGNSFYSWFVEQLISYGASIFLIVPLALAIIERRLPNEYITLSLIGGTCLLVYSLILQKSPNEIIIIILKTIVTVTLLSAFFSIVKKLVDSGMTNKWNWNKKSTKKWFK